MTCRCRVVRGGRLCPGTQGRVVAFRTEGGSACDVETIRYFIIASSSWSFKCVKCIAVCYSTQFPASYLWCMDMLGWDAHEDVVIAGLEIITVRLLESLDIITE